MPCLLSFADFADQAKSDTACLLDFPALFPTLPLHDFTFVSACLVGAREPGISHTTSPKRGHKQQAQQSLKLYHHAIRPHRLPCRALPGLSLPTVVHLASTIRHTIPESFLQHRSIGESTACCVSTSPTGAATMVYSLTYRRPSHVTSSRDSLNGDEKQKSIQESISSGNSCMSHGIPTALGFDRIIDGGTCPVSSP